jgi:hypothetical protein
MSDERFDEDLRAVLREAAPRDVPDDLRRRIDGIPAAHPVAASGTRWGWLRPLPAGLGALVVVGLVAAITVWRLGPGPVPGVGSSANPTNTFPSVPTAPPAAPSSAAASPAASSSAVTAQATPTPTSGPVNCQSFDLTGRILDWLGAAGSRIADIEITNKSSTACRVRGTPGLRLVDATGRVLIDSASLGASGRPHVASGDPSFEVAPGGTLRTQVEASNYCGPDPVLPLSIKLVLPANAGTLTARPASGVSSDESVPPCNGPGSGPQIAMNGWRR